MPLEIIVGVVAAVMVVRWMIARHVERGDARRPRGADGIVVGAEGFVLERAGAPGVLLLHGAGDTPQTLRDLGMFLHAKGYAVSAPLLPGHGRSVRAFRHVSLAAWEHAALDAFDTLSRGHPWSGVVGLSMGGALAALVAANRPTASALVLLAPYLELPRGLRLTADISRIAGLFSPYYGASDTRSVHDPIAAAKGLAYGVFTPNALRALRATSAAGAAALPNVHCPTLIVQSRQDNRVSPAVAERALPRLGSADKRLEWISDGGHIITVDYGKERVFALTAEWLGTHGAASLLRP